jgi:hypothetical protein
MRIPPVFAVAFAFFDLFYVLFGFYPLFLVSPSRENYCPLSLDTFPLEHSRSFPQDR